MIIGINASHGLCLQSVDRSGHGNSAAMIEPLSVKQERDKASHVRREDDRPQSKDGNCKQ